MLAKISETLTQWLGAATGFLYGYGLVYLLIGVGVVLTAYLGAPQLRYIGAIFSSMSGSRKGSGGGISSFQAFAVGVATRVGIGNIGGVALALVVGGAGAIFWMWVVAFIGMATAIAESTLAQIFKVRFPDGTFRGGPAYYISRGLRLPFAGKIFAFISVFACGISVPMVQVNTVAATFEANHAIPTWVTALIVVALLAPVILGGLRSVARVSEYLAPVMAIAYVFITLVVIIMNLGQAGQALATIVASAFGLKAGLGGLAGGIWVALINGARRGLFSNEAGLGTSPNAAGTATVSHPVSQGFIQSFGVFIDTMIVCTCTALLILISGKYVAGVTTPDQAGALTAQAVSAELGAFMAIPMSIIIFIFGYTSAFGAYSYGQVSLDYLTKNRIVSLLFRLMVVVLCGVGAVAQLITVWTLADFLLGLGAIINLVALLALAPWVRGALKDWNYQHQAGKAPQFIGVNNEYLPKDVPGQVWTVGDNAHESAKRNPQ